MKRITIFLCLLSLLFIPKVLFGPVGKSTALIVYNEPIKKILPAEFLRYADSLGFKESRNNPNITNSIGCFGEHQWKESTLHGLGYKDITLKKFKKDPSIFPREEQRHALYDFTISNEAKLQPFMVYIGTEIGGVKITKSGLLAACHLAGIGNVRKFLFLNGKTIIVNGFPLSILSARNKLRHNSKDKNGTSILSYLKEFQGFNL